MPFIVAEAGLNHGGYLERAIELCRLAKDAGADAVKFQLTDVDSTLKTSWWTGKEELAEKIKGCEMRFDAWEEVAEKCKRLNIELIFTPSTVRMIDWAVALGVRKIKIGSDRANDIHLIDKASKTGKPLFISEGMHRVHELLKSARIYCVSKYPAELMDYDRIPPRYEGISDHTLDKTGILVLYYKTVPVTMRGYYEKHFKLDDDCIDAATALNPIDFRELVGNMEAKYYD